MTNRTVPHVVFEDEGGRLTKALMEKRERGDVGLGGPSVREFAEILAVCHTVIPEMDEEAEGGMVLQAASPDEGALVHAAAYFGYEFHTRTPSSVTVSVFGEDVEYEILVIVPFTSARKRSTVVVRGPDGKIVVMTKGADVVLMELLDEMTANNVRIYNATQAHLDRFATLGLRTLVAAKRELSLRWWSEWYAEYQEVESSAESAARTSALESLYDALETDLVLVGATAIEDKLQDGVPYALATLREAGIRVWVLTGDKQETAIMIGYSCSLLTPSMQVVVLNASEEAKAAAGSQDALDRVRAMLLTFMEDQIELFLGGAGEHGEGDVGAAGEEGVSPFAVVIDGYTLRMILGEPGRRRLWDEKEEEEDMLTVRLREALLDLTVEAVSVVACRVSPAQKAQMVRFVQSAMNPVSLAIGDGANDVDMIREANIGVGISGEEGAQAALASDYSIAQFRFLVPLLLVHGHWCYHRISTLIFYCFYKNMALALVPFWFSFFNGFSGQTFVERWTIAMYNTLYTALPIICMGLYDQVLTRPSLLAYPKLYYRGQNNRYFSLRTFVGWLLSAVYHSTVFFFFVQGAIRHNVHASDGKVTGLYGNGLFLYSTVIVTVNIKAALELSTWNVITTSALVASFVLYFGWVIGYSYATPIFRDGSNMESVGPRVLGTPLFWLVVVIGPCVALLPNYVFKYARRWYTPEPADIVKELHVASTPASDGGEGGDVSSTGVRALLGSVHTLLQTVVPIWPKSILVQPSGFAFEPEPEGHVSVIMDPQGQAHGRRAASYAPPTVRVESGEFPSTVSWSSRAPSAHGLERGSSFQSFQNPGGSMPVVQAHAQHHHRSASHHGGAHTTPDLGRRGKEEVDGSEFASRSSASSDGGRGVGGRDDGGGDDGGRDDDGGDKGGGRRGPPVRPPRKTRTLSPDPVAMHLPERPRRPSGLDQSASSFSGGLNTSATSIGFSSSLNSSRQNIRTFQDAMSTHSEDSDVIRAVRNRRSSSTSRSRSRHRRRRRRRHPPPTTTPVPTSTTHAR